MRFWILSVTILLVAGGEAVAQLPPSSYFTIVPGDVPILLTAPHGGTLSYPFPPRSCTGSETCVLDTNTRLLAPQASDDFFALTGKRPYLIVAQGHREYIDLNRDKAASPNNAFSNPAAEPFYDFYHDAVQGFIDDIQSQYGRGLLLDIHGQSAQPGDILRGTKDGLTASDLIQEFGSDPSLNGPNSILGSLDALGYSVDPDASIPFADQVEVPGYNGGYTVQAYGSHQASGMDAIQLEFGIDYRGGSAWEATAADLAIAMRDFYGAYLAQQPGDFNGDGATDGSDFLTWQRGFGLSSGATITDGDANGDTLVNGDDLPIWKNHFGSSASGLASAAAVPEPSSLVLLFCGLIPSRQFGRRNLLPSKLGRGK
ncbi:hypothetical protein [Adhaeretor mobilis]|uniref:N-formylglutamate amidohydrolase n=1 Tax=Adhaeretor mobilis TaxID=1930276 RepID=A0A517MTM7_9BACT|nr:hypothetical protein [Adhaeretor mobilis]QDS98233.1 N-formylglutamate amidohydrolase [Adhaeretor mobilis]